MPEYPGLRLIKKFSSVTQWTGEERQAILVQLMAAITPLLLENHSD